MLAYFLLILSNRYSTNSIFYEKESNYFRTITDASWSKGFVRMASEKRYG